MFLYADYERLTGAIHTKIEIALVVQIAPN